MIMLVSAGALVVLMLVTWALSLALRDVSIVDVVWGAAFACVAWIAFAAGDGDGAARTLAAVLTTVWAARLAGYLLWRKRKQDRGEDRRYAEMRERHGARFALVSLGTVFLAQAAAAWVVSLPLQATGALHGGLGWLDFVGVACWAAGLACEAIGDAQLARFKSEPANRGQVMDRGLWRYTRHPNYFGDFLVWWGLGMIALSAGAWWALAGPLVMSVLLVRISGKDLLERSIGERRPGYADYVRRTSGFVPLPPRAARGWSR